MHQKYKKCSREIFPHLPRYHVLLPVPSVSVLLEKLVAEFLFWLVNLSKQNTLPRIEVCMCYWCKAHVDNTKILYSPFFQFNNSPRTADVEWSQSLFDCLSLIKYQYMASMKIKGHFIFEALANMQRSNWPKTAATTWSSPSWNPSLPINCQWSSLPLKWTITISQCSYSLSDLDHMN